MSSQSDSNEEAYILEKKEISTDHDHSFEYKSIKDIDEEDHTTLSFMQEEDDDLDDFEKLKAHTTLKQQLQTGQELSTLKKAELKPKVVKREIVIDDYI